MTAMLLVLWFGDAAANANEAADDDLVADSWARADRSALLQRRIDGVGIVRIGPPRADDDLPYAL